MAEAEDALAEALAALGLALDEAVVARLLQYASLLARHGAMHNLVGTLEPARIAVEIVADSLVALDALRDVDSVIDVGSGAGVPGLPLAIALPDTRFTLLEPRRKRVDFLLAARRTLGLGNVTAVEGRTDTMCTAIASGRQAPFGAAVSRAVFAPGEWVTEARTLVRSGAPIGVWLSAGNAPGFVEEHTLHQHRVYQLPGLDERQFAIVQA